VSRLELLVWQFDQWWELLSTRLVGLSDD